jgi:hypothetical protein
MTAAREAVSITAAGTARTVGRAERATVIRKTAGMVRTAGRAARAARGKETAAERAARAAAPSQSRNFCVCLPSLRAQSLSMLSGMYCIYVRMDGTPPPPTMT